MPKSKIKPKTSIEIIMQHLNLNDPYNITQNPPSQTLSLASEYSDPASPKMEIEHIPTTEPPQQEIKIADPTPKIDNENKESNQPDRPRILAPEQPNNKKKLNVTFNNLINGPTLVAKKDPLPVAVLIKRDGQVYSTKNYKNFNPNFHANNMPIKNNAWKPPSLMSLHIPHPYRIPINNNLPSTSQATTRQFFTNQKKIFFPTPK